jgi:disulfide bond formation protein DsbB
MGVQVAENFFGLLTIVANIALVAVLALAVGTLHPEGRSIRDRVALVLRPSLLPMLVLVSLTTMGGSLYFSEVAGFTPCRYCWFARIALYPLSALFLTAVALRSRAATVRPFAVPLAVAAIGISGYHYFIEWFPPHSTSCEITAPCTAVWFRSFGFASLAWMSVSAGALVLALVWLWRCADRAADQLGAEDALAGPESADEAGDEAAVGMLTGDETAERFTVPSVDSPETTPPSLPS